jgi:hypothetical protein
MNNRINLLFDEDTLQGVKKVQAFMRERKTTTTIRWLIESSLIYIEEGEVSPILKLLHENKTQVNAQRTDICH